MWNYSDIITEMKDIINKCPIKMKTYVYGYINEADLNKKNIYPLVNIEPGEKSWTEYGHLVYSFSVAFLDQRDIVKSENFDKLFGNDNLIDNMNKIDYITNYFQAHLKLQRNAFEITNERCETLFYKNQNILDGYLMTFDLIIQNNIDICQ